MEAGRVSHICQHGHDRLNSLEQSHRDGDDSHMVTATTKKQKVLDSPYQERLARIQCFLTFASGFSPG
jgi:hypothetical protein